MISITILLAWVAVGLIATIVWSEPGEPRFAWAPMAIILGPLWFVITAERRLQPVVVSAGSERSHVGPRSEYAHRSVGQP